MQSGDLMRAISIPLNDWSIIPMNERRISENIGAPRQSETVRLRGVACADFQRWSGEKRTRISFGSRGSPTQKVGSASKSKARGFTTFRGIVLLSTHVRNSSMHAWRSQGCEKLYNMALASERRVHPESQRRS